MAKGRKGGEGLVVCFFFIEALGGGRPTVWAVYVFFKLNASTLTGLYTFRSFQMLLIFFPYDNIMKFTLKINLLESENI